MLVISISIIATCSLVITVKLVNLIEFKIRDLKLKRILKWTELAVNAAEQLGNNNKIGKNIKFNYVKEFLKHKGFDYTDEEFEVLIDGYVNKSINNK